MLDSRLKRRGNRIHAKMYMRNNGVHNRDMFRNSHASVVCGGAYKQCFQTLSFVKRSNSEFIWIFFSSNCAAKYILWKPMVVVSVNEKRRYFVRDGYACQYFSLYSCLNRVNEMKRVITTSLISDSYSRGNVTNKILLFINYVSVFVHDIN